MEPQMVFQEKSVIIHRDESGFGLRVGGQNPVFVDCVHENGAAWKAGVRKDDRIIKVNGTLVRSYDHKQVVRMIKNCTPFVNLTLHSPQTVAPTDTYNVVSSSNLQSTEPNNTGGILLNTSNNNANNNIITSSMKVHSLQQRLHHPDHLNWFYGLGDDLFQDNHHQKPTQHQQQHVISDNNIPVTSSAHQSSGVSKLIVSGPSPLISSHSQLSNSSGKPKLRHNINQLSTRENPYYYYKTAPEKVPEVTSCNSATSSLLSHDQGTSTKSSLSIVRSRSSSKMSTRSTTGKYKARNLRSRLVEDLRSLTITNSQTTPSSLSTSPSSSDLSDCDDQDSSRLDCLSLSTSANTSASGTNLAMSNANSSSSANTGGSINLQAGPINPKHTTRRLEIIRELIDTEKTHTERLKHLNDLIYKPIKAEGLVPVDQLKMVFSCHKTLFKIHRQIYKILSAAQQNTSDCHQEPLVGKALVEIFEGELGKRLERAASTFCACQSTNTELLNKFTRKDTKAGEFLAQVANQQMIGRLGIKDLLASCFQRLTKYPLLLDNLLKATPLGTCGIHSKSLSEGSIATSLASSIINTATTEGLTTQDNNDLDELTSSSVTSTKATTTTTTPSTDNRQTSAAITSALVNNNNEDDDDEDNSKYNVSNNKKQPIPTEIVNITTKPTTTTSIAKTLDDDYAYERLCISRALHQSRQILIHVNEAVKRAISHNKLRDIWKKTDKYFAKDQPVIDIETQQLLHEGTLTLRLARRSFEVYVLLLTHYIIILTREGQDKYKLKHFTADANQYSPIFNIDEHLATRDTATDENGFYLVYNSKSKKDARIYEFASQSPSERAKWKEKIHMAQLYNYAAVPDDDNTLNRYRELISLATSSNTPNNIEHSPTTTTNSIHTITAPILVTSVVAQSHTGSNSEVSYDTPTTVCP